MAHVFLELCREVWHFGTPDRKLCKEESRSEIAQYTGQQIPAWFSTSAMIKMQFQIEEAYPEAQLDFVGLKFIKLGEVSLKNKNQKSIIRYKILKWTHASKRS